MTTLQCLVHLVRFSSGRMFVVTLTRLFAFAVVPQLIALIMRAYFNALTGAAPVAFTPMTLCILLIALAMARIAVIFADIPLHFATLFRFGALMRKNILLRILNRPDTSALPSSSGEAMSRFRGDVDTIAEFLMQLPFQISFVGCGVLAFAIMVSINATVTFAVIVPMAIILVGARVSLRRVEEYRKANREASGEVTGFIGELFNTAETVKAAGAEEYMQKRFEILNERRRVVSLRDQFFDRLMQAFFSNSTTLATGLILIISGQSMRNGTFTVGDLALFTFLMEWVCGVIEYVGGFLVRYRQVRVSVDRLVELLGDADRSALVAHSPVHLHGPLPAMQHEVKTDSHRLHSLRAEGVSYRYGQGAAGLHNVSFTIERGSFTVITGRIGSGKTTLLRVVLGLLPRSSGTLRWNGEIIEDPAAFMVPPRTAYTPQVPRLFSESLRDNILMGMHADGLDAALAAAVLEADIKELEAGLDTVVGPRGIRLSGGQAQRAAAARMFVREPELLVFDDLSSALDVDTEQLLWERIDLLRQATGTTCLVVSNRRVALHRADRILLMQNGRIVATGTLDELLKMSEEMRSIWHGHAT